MKAWRRRSSEGPTAGESCGDQPTDVSLAAPGGGDLELSWVWGGGGLEPGTIEQSVEGSGVWEPVTDVQPLGAGLASWASGKPTDTVMIARIRRSASGEACSVVSNSAIVA
jgi:hypothetical protein